MVENAFWGFVRQLWAPSASFDAGRGRGVRAGEGTSLSRAAQVAKRSHTMTFCRRSSTVTKGRRCLPPSTTSTYWSLDDDLQQLQKVNKKICSPWNLRYRNNCCSLLLAVQEMEHHVNGWRNPLCLHILPSRV